MAMWEITQGYHVKMMASDGRVAGMGVQEMHTKVLSINMNRIKHVKPTGVEETRFYLWIGLICLRILATGRLT